MLPVVSHQTFVGQPFVFRRHGVLAHHNDAARIEPRAEHLACKFAWHRVAVASNHHQAGRRHPCRAFNITDVRNEAVLG
jgi:hypothetical protein